MRVTPQPPPPPAADECSAPHRALPNGPSDHAVGAGAEPPPAQAVALSRQEPPFALPCPGPAREAPGAHGECTRLEPPACSRPVALALSRGINPLLTEPGSDQSAAERLRRGGCSRSCGEVPRDPLRQALGRRNSLRGRDGSHPAQSPRERIRASSRDPGGHQLSMHHLLTSSFSGEGGKGLLKATINYRLRLEFRNTCR